MYRRTPIDNVSLCLQYDNIFKIKKINGTCIKRSGIN